VSAATSARWWRPGCLYITLPPGEGELVADRCWSLGATAIGEAGGALEVGFETVAAALDAAGALGEWRQDLGLAVVDAQPALDAALEAWKPYACPVRVGRLHVRPAWLAPDDDPPAPGERAVVVDPSRAFGYDHPSTLACLAEIERLAAPGVAVLDVGCGSGVLAVAAAVLGAGPVVAIDTDPVAVAATTASAVSNGVVIDASSMAVGEVGGRFDLVVANIGAHTLVERALAIAARVEAGGHLVLAGLLPSQTPEVVSVYESEGLATVAVGERDGWASPVFRRFS
jgi:ribosomal protein L11 methyltransferase